MEVLEDGKDWSWTDYQFDPAVLNRQAVFFEEDKSIWGGRNCGKCGVCCYVLRVDEINKPAYTPCPHLKINDIGAECELHDEDKPKTCAKWGCYKNCELQDRAQRYLFAQIAVDILGSKCQEDINRLIE